MSTEFTAAERAALMQEISELRKENARNQAGNAKVARDELMNTFRELLAETKANGRMLRLNNDQQKTIIETIRWQPPALPPLSPALEPYDDGSSDAGFKYSSPSGRKKGWVNLRLGWHENKKYLAAGSAFGALYSLFEAFKLLVTHAR